ncbi:McrC family protein [bacterium]|nr:McrC family protein [bacterium]
MIDAPAQKLRATPVLELREWEAGKVIHGQHLSAADRAALEQLAAQKRNALSVIDGVEGLHIRTTQWVGVVRTPELSFQIRPKFSGGHLDLVRLIAYVYGSEGLSILKEEEWMTSGEDNLLDLVMTMFVFSTLHLVRRGIIRDYLLEEDALPVLRGSLDMQKQYRKRFGALDLLHCRYDEYSPLIADNLLVLAGLELCAKLIPPRAIQPRHRRLHAIFSELCDIRWVDPSIADEEFQYHRQNRHYRSAHGYARMLLRGIGVEDVFTRASLRSYSFLLDMNAIFQGFVERFLQQMFFGSTVRVRTQESRAMHIVWDEGKGRKRIRPDIVLRDTAVPSRWLVADSKYKRLDTYDVSNSDLYQLFLYSYAYDKDIRRACLFYPSETEQFEYRSLRIQDARGRMGARIWIIGLPVSHILRHTAHLAGDTAITDCRNRLLKILNDDALSDTAVQKHT